MIFFDASLLRDKWLEPFDLYFIILEGLLKLLLLIIFAFKIEELVREIFLEKRLCQACKATECDRCEAEERARGFNYHRIRAFENELADLRAEIQLLQQVISIEGVCDD